LCGAYRSPECDVERVKMLGRLLLYLATIASLVLVAVSAANAGQY